MTASEEEYAARLSEVFQRVTKWQEAASAGTLYRSPERRSEMARYDRLTTPLQLSHAVQGLLNVSIEHQHALGSLIEGARVLHSTAPFTLTRSAVESASTAYWMLHRTDSRREPIRRLVIFHNQDRYDYAQVATMVQEVVGGELPKTLAKRREWIDAIIKNNSVTGLPKSGLQIADMIKDVDAAVGADIRVELYWRMASAFAHGRQWPSLNVLVRQDVKAISPDVAGVRFESDYGRVLWGANIAYGLTNRALHLYDKLAQRPSR